MVVAIGAAAFATRATAPGGFGTRVAASQLAAAELAQTPANFLKSYSGEQLDSPQVRLYLSDSPFDLAIVGWNDERTTITSVTLAATQGNADVGSLTQGLKQYLGPHFRSDESSVGARYPDRSHLYLKSDGTTFLFRAEPEDGERSNWQARGRALWTVLANVGLGGSRPMSDAERKLLVGHPLSALAKIDPSVVVDGAEQHLRSLFPAVVASQSSELELQILLDHPWFGSATLSWENEQGGRMKQLKLWHPASNDTLSDLEGIARCLEPALGKAEVNVTDHLKKTKSYRWSGTSYWEDGTHLGGNNVFFNMPPTPSAKQRLNAIATTLDRCGRL